MRRVVQIPLILLLGAGAACDGALTEPGRLAPVAAAAARAEPGTKIRPICDPDNGGIDLPGGFCAVVVHDAKGPTGEAARARHIAVAPNGDVFVAIDSEGGGVLALRDTDGDGKADESATFGAEPGHGIAFRAPYLWFATEDRVERYLMSPATLTPVSGPEVIVSGMPDSGDHVTKSIVVAEDGALFVNLGSASDVCQVVNRQPGSPGVDPCPELPIRSGIWRYEANLPGQVHTPDARFATGTRNMVALALNPFNGDLYGVQHGRDNLNHYWPEQFTLEDQANLPAEEFFRFIEGGDYGWPYCYYDHFQELKVLGPEYGGDGTIEGRCEAKELPIHTFPAHWAPNALLFYSGDQFPARYREGAFVAFHGGFNRPDPFVDEGFNVTFVPFRNGLPSHQDQVFADGFIGEDAESLPGEADHRPTGLAQGPDGSLYITDDRSGRIWRVLHARRN